ncbi:MAG: nitroreductase family protein [Candidatus Omnitrophica bacterium]|nr:nitroreductase family protein [Candidatus Omnitrophota bacterium]
MKIIRSMILTVFLIGIAALGYPEDNPTLKVIYSRKSVRHYIDRKATKEDLLTLVKAGMAAPTAVDRRPWAFVIVTDKAKLEELEAGLPYAKMLTKSGAGIIVCGVMEKALPGEGKEFWIQDCSAATENILLAAESIGLGAVWTGAYPSKERMDYIRKVLGMPENIVPLNVIPVGYPVGDEKPKDKFDPVNVHWEKW